MVVTSSYRHKMTSVSETTDLTEPSGAPGPLLASGSWSDIFILDHGRLLRRNRHHDVSEREVELLRHVSAAGFPAPTPFAVDGPDLILERLHGPTLLQSLAAGETRLSDGARILADLHAQLHAVAPPADAEPGQVVVHLDLHPANVILTETYGPALIDWTGATLGDPDLDLAVTALVLAEVAVDDEVEYARGAHLLLVSFLAACGGGPAAHLDDAIRARLATRVLDQDERALLPVAAALVRQVLAA